TIRVAGFFGATATSRHPRRSLWGSRSSPCGGECTFATRVRATAREETAPQQKTPEECGICTRSREPLVAHERPPKHHGVRPFEETHTPCFIPTTQRNRVRVFCVSERRLARMLGPASTLGKVHRADT